MSYKREFIQSPNYTPGAQAKAAYGRIRTLEIGAGHWWGDPNAGYQHQGIINTFLNPSRQASAHAIVSEGRVTEMVRPGDIAWATNNANPYTYSIELKPNMTAGDKETCAEYIADMGFHNLPWKPHNQLGNPSTSCNPLPWDQIRARAQQIYAAKHAATPPAVPEWQKNLKARAAQTLYIKRNDAPLRNLANPAEVIKTYAKGTSMEIVAETKVNGYVYYLTRYSFEHGTGQGFDEYELEQAPAPVPEWIQNLVDINDVKLMVLVPQTNIINLGTGQPISPLAQGTWVDFAKKTTVGGKEFLLSNYSVANNLPNGIAVSDVGMPVVEPPVEDKPEWLKNWRDIADVTMYARADVPVINLITGDTIGTVARGTAVQVASATDWHGQPYFITEYSTAKKLPNGIRVVDLDMKQQEAEPPVIPPVESNDDLIKETNAIVKWIKEVIKLIAAKLGITL